MALLGAQDGRSRLGRQALFVRSRARAGRHPCQRSIAAQDEFLSISREEAREQLGSEMLARSPYTS
jgi:hypothetical protein